MMTESLIYGKFLSCTMVVLSQFYAFSFCYFLAFVNDFSMQFSIRGAGDVFFLNRCVGDLFSFFRRFAVNTNTFLKNQRYTGLACPMTKMY
jgi:hypothetical protein